MIDDGKINLIVIGIVSIIISTIFTFNSSNSRYIGEIKTEDQVLAIPVITLSNNMQSYSIENMLPGDEQEYLFQVSNVEGQQNNEILLSYCFKITKQSEIPLEIEIYEVLANGTEQKIMINDNISENINMNVVSLESDKVTKNYKLKIIWPENDNSFEYAGQIINMNVTLEATQVI